MGYIPGLHCEMLVVTVIEGVQFGCFVDNHIPGTKSDDELL